MLAAAARDDSVEYCNGKGRAAGLGGGGHFFACLRSAGFLAGVRVGFDAVGAPGARLADSL